MKLPLHNGAKSSRLQLRTEITVIVIVTIIIVFSKIFYYSEDVKGYEFSVTDFRILVNVAFQSEIYTIHVKYYWF